MTIETATVSPDAPGVTLQTLQQAIDEELEKKRRLGHYYVVWQDGKAIAVGDDAPSAE